MCTYFSKDRMSTFARLVEPIQKCVVRYVNEKLRASTFWLSRIGHGKSSHSIGNTVLRLSNLVGNSTLGISTVRLAITALELGTRLRSTGSSSGRVGVLGMRAAKLIHKTRNHAVEMLNVERENAECWELDTNCDWKKNASFLCMRVRYSKQSEWPVINRGKLTMPS